AEIKAIQEALILAPSEIDRENILFTNPPDATNITFQFVNVTHRAPTGGEIVLNSVDNFPALIGTKVSAAIGFVDACGLNVPHSHPRANEFLTVVDGTLIGGLMLEEIPDNTGVINATLNGTIPIPMVTATLTNFTRMLFPQGQVHFQFNPTCEPAVFAAAFDNNDSGRIQIANTFFSVGFDDVLETAVGNSESLGAAQLDALKGHIPDAFAELMNDCAKMCGIP
ncbi:RmlC-like cupin, partial [Mollisia scopiformis]